MFSVICSLHGKQVHAIPPDVIGDVENVLAVCRKERATSKDDHAVAGCIFVIPKGWGGVPSNTSLPPQHRPVACRFHS
ncbi:hypothetical protein L1987_17458 [Smallanthus sonchifolius]|uniref:Uncharacterized protein n=1 Tax=Smallanthus sonchifolius TaxID=185202 RepID=A0ACB9IZ62_9ASTR|nr:hypothetical protein L1987_17458 [Smallanthus sonchifolius]